MLPVLVLLAGKMPALQEILGYFLNWKSLILLAGKMPAPQEILGYFFIWKSLNKYGKVFVALRMVRYAIANTPYLLLIYARLNSSNY
jgi:hypothetical protein